MFRLYFTAAAVGDCEAHTCVQAGGPLHLAQGARGQYFRMRVCVRACPCVPLQVPLNTSPPARRLAGVGTAAECLLQRHIIKCPVLYSHTQHAQTLNYWNRTPSGYVAASLAICPPPHTPYARLLPPTPLPSSVTTATTLLTATLQPSSWRSVGGGVAGQEVGWLAL